MEIHLLRIQYSAAFCKSRTGRNLERAAQQYEPFFLPMPRKGNEGVDQERD